MSDYSLYLLTHRIRQTISTPPQRDIEILKDVPMSLYVCPFGPFVTRFCTRPGLKAFERSRCSEMFSPLSNYLSSSLAFIYGFFSPFVLPRSYSFLMVNSGSFRLELYYQFHVQGLCYLSQGFDVGLLKPSPFQTG
jgi:hypothetical protein